MSIEMQIETMEQNEIDTVKSDISIFKKWQDKDKVRENEYRQH